MDVLRHCEREIVRALAATGSTQSQVTHADRFEIATDDVVVKVWTNDAYERERGAVERAVIAEDHIAEAEHALRDLGSPDEPPRPLSQRIRELLPDFQRGQ